MSRRNWLLGAALLAVALLLTLALPHGHAGNGQLSKDDCILCHAHHARAIESRTADAIPDFNRASRHDEFLDGEERDAVLGRHPSRAPPA